MPDDPTLLTMVDRIQRFPEMSGCIIGYEGDGQSRILSYGYPTSTSRQCVAIVIEKVVEPDMASVKELTEFADKPAGSPEGQANPRIVTNGSRIGPELIGAGVGCGLTLVSAIGVIGGAAAEVPTGGASTFLIIASWTGLTTGAVQCLNGLVRVGAILAAPEDNTLERWDANLTYSTSILIVDGMGIASGIGSLPFAARNLFAVLARQRAFVARGLTFESLRGMNRVQRLKVISEVFEDAAKTPEGRRALGQAAREAQVGSNALQRTSGLSVRHSQTLKRVISDETARRLNSSLRDVLTSMAGVGASATPAAMTGSASGSVNYIINLVDAGAPKN